MTNPNDPAFLTKPEVYYLREPDKDCDIRYGLTKREYFAAMAMQGILANPSAMESVARVHKADLPGAEITVSCMAMRYADALIAELSK